MLKFILKRVGQAIPVLFILIALTFFFIRLAPGGPFDAEKAVPPEVLENLNERYHLNDPLYQQFFDYFGNLLQFDLGPSFKFPGRTVNELIATGVPLTAELGLYAILIALVIGVTAGVIAALRPNTKTDYVPMSVAMVGICMPSFLLGPLLVLVFGIWLEWLPISGWDYADQKILPSITLGSAYAAYIARLSRAGMLEILNQDFIRTARAKGLPEKLVVLRHAMKGAILPVISFLGPAAAGLIAGSFVVETIFQIPGIGRFYVQAAFNRDYTMIMGMTIFFGTLIVLFNLFSDLVAIWLNPRLSYEAEGSRA